MNTEFPVFNEFGKVSISTPKIQSSGLSLGRILLIGAIIATAFGLIYWFIRWISTDKKSEVSLNDKDDSSNSSEDYPPFKDFGNPNFGNGFYG